MHADTIFALSSAAGRAGVAVIRVSGKDAFESWRRLTGIAVPPARRLVRVSLRDGVRPIDSGLGVIFEGPRSFTGEDVVEFHVHGGRAVIDGVLVALGVCTGLRPADPGEFTRRAFENGKLDLTEAEGILDLIEAETEEQRLQALRQAEGALSRQYDGWRERAVRILGYVEGAIDFSDEGLDEGLVREAKALAAGLLGDLNRHLDKGRRGERVRQGFYIAIVGAPNVGKSSLLNRLAGREAAIVSEKAGTTRDIIEVRMNLGGYAVTLADTAGIREAGEAIEAEGVRRARAAAARADLTVVVGDASAPETDIGEVGDGTVVRVRNKIDLVEGGGDGEVLGLSARTGEGVDALEADLVARIGDMGAGREDGVVWTRERHRHGIAAAASELERFCDIEEVDLGAEHLRRAIRSLARVVGRVDVEDVLDMIFREFCIGK